MKVLYYDCFCGISGDMNLGALIDLGVDHEYLIREISKLQLDSEYEIKIKRDTKKGLSGIKFDVILKHGEINQVNNHHHHHHDNNHDGDELKDDYHYEKHEHKHRNFKDIENIINSSNLNDRVKKLSLNMLVRVAGAEAIVHGKSVDEVHFHEVGAIDSIIDIVGAAVALDFLKVDKIMASSVQVGGGFVKCAHGLIPVPAPATVEILKNIPIKSGIVPFETTTPTGAAILAENVEAYTDKIEFSIEKIGYGIGNRELSIPNVLRVYLGTLKKCEVIEEQYILETNIDDMNPELWSYVEEKLFGKGALDVFKTSIIMKKGRPAIKLSVLVDGEKEKDIQEIIFKETTSIGIRKYKVEKIMLNRELLKLSTQYGDLTFKNSYYKDELVKYKPEYEDCLRIAKENDISIREVYREANRVYEEHSCNQIT